MKMKMEKPELEVVRFRTADVIATSDEAAGPSFQSLTAGETYYVRSSEAKAAGETYWALDFMKFATGVYNGSTIPIEGTGGKVSDNFGSNTDHLYAWYDNGQWWTEGKTPADYNGNWRVNNNT